MTTRQNSGGILLPFASEPDPSPLFIRIETWDLREKATPSLTSTSNVYAADLSKTLGRTANVSFNPKEDLKEGYIWLDDLPVPGLEGSAPMLLHERQTRHDRESISFDFRTRDNIVVSARRSKYRSKKKTLKLCQQHHEKPATSIEILPEWNSSDSESSSSEDEDDNAAEETCSEGSTDFDSDEESTDCGTDEQDDTSSDGDDAASDTANDDPSDDDSYDSASSYDEDGYPKPSRKGSSQRRNNTFTSGIIGGNLALDKGEREATRTKEKPMSRLSERKNMINASLSVYDISSGRPVRLFHLQQNLPVMLYSSPPAIHPTKSLVAWPLGGGDILFADYLANTYFIRGAVPNTQDSKRSELLLIMSTPSAVQAVNS